MQTHRDDDAPQRARMDRAIEDETSDRVTGKPTFAYLRDKALRLGEEGLTDAEAKQLDEWRLRAANKRMDDADKVVTRSRLEAELLENADQESLQKLAEFEVAQGGPSPAEVQALAALEEKAKKMTAAGENYVTAGAPGEVPLLERKVGRIHVCRLPADPMAVRISIGACFEVADTNYFSFRGEPDDVEQLLLAAVEAIREVLGDAELEARMTRTSAEADGEVAR